MPKLDGTGPDRQGSGTGRKLGKCSDLPDEQKLQKLGKGMGKKRNSGGGKGKGKRLKSAENKLLTK
ncbi:MAG: hypothetical protein Kow0068_14830 [Marinilabiliales bacterium]